MNKEKDIDEILNRVSEDTKREKNPKYSNMSVDDLLSSINENKGRKKDDIVAEAIESSKAKLSEQAAEITPEILVNESSASDDIIQKIRKSAADTISEIEKKAEDTEESAVSEITEEPKVKDKKESLEINAEAEKIDEKKSDNSASEINNDSEKKVNTSANTKEKKSFFKKLLDEDPSELVNIPKETPEKIKKEIREDSPARKKTYKFLGVIVTLFACIGIIATVFSGIEYVGRFASGKTKMDGFEKVVYPAVIMDIASFQSPSELSSDQIITAAIWSMVMSDGGLEKYQNTFDVVSVPAVDVEANAVKIFGEELPELVHTTVGPAESRFYYNEETKSYNVPVKPVVYTYYPEIVSVNRTDNEYSVVVDYIDELPEWIESKTSKTAKYTICEVNGNYMIKSMEMVYSANSL